MRSKVCRKHGTQYTTCPADGCQYCPSCWNACPRTWADPKAPRWIYRAALPCPDLQDRPCHALIGPHETIWIAPFDPRTAHIYARQATRLLVTLRRGTHRAP